ncbi:enoyl-CoA hydratase-related protein [Nocardioides massiliensis]|uniref:enoyl-CoA hydratase-related protein n=1 Tax=Nocardioides massiliensis TaxID=1325935 RepID=UPI000835F3CC|nr:enoyl-CoA hydratase-related protein [Nocardioides massiliensis]
MTTEDLRRIRIDDPAPGVRRVTLARPAKRNALDGVARREVLAAADERCRVVVIAADGPDFCAGYDLDPAEGEKYADAGAGPGRFTREVVEGWLSLTELRLPVIAQVHGHCLAGGSELVACCDLVYVADDARIGYPAVRFGVPDLQYHPWLMGMRRAMEAVLTGDVVVGAEAVEAGLANRAYPAAELEAQVLAQAARIAAIPAEIVQINKRTVHRAMQAMGMHTAVRAGTDACVVATGTEAFGQFMAAASGGRVTAALDERDRPFGDGRTRTEAG